VAGLAIEYNTVTEDASNLMLLSKTTLGESPGLDPSGTHCQHAIECTNLGARTWAIAAMGPAGTFHTLASGLTTEIFCVGPRYTGILGAAAEETIRFRSREYRITMSGAGAGAIAHVQSELVGMG